MSRHKFHPVTNLTGGLNLSMDPALIPEIDSPNVICTRFDEGLIKKDLGSVSFGDALLGTPLHIDDYPQVDGDTFTICLTTTSAFSYNEDTNCWEDITEGFTIEDCEDVWVAKPDVSCVQDTTTYKRGTSSIKITPSVSFLTGILCTEVITSKNLSTHDHIHLWVKSSIALDAGDLQLLLDDTAVCASPIESIDLPALEADTWTRVSIALAAVASDTAIISVGFNLTKAKGTFSLNVDDIRSVIEFTGTLDSRFSTCTLNDYFIITNGIDSMKTFNGTVIADLGGSPPLAKTVVAYQNRLLVAGTVEGGQDYPQRVRWSSAGTIAIWSGGTSGYIDVIDTVDWCVHLSLLRDKCFLYKERSIWEIMYVGGTAVFKPQVRVGGIGTLHPMSVQDLGESHQFFGSDSIYDFDGVHLEDEGEKIFPLLYKTGSKIVDLTYPKRVSSVFVEELGEYWLALPTTDSEGVPDVLLKQSLDKAWSRRNGQNITCFGYYSVASEHVAWEDLTGTWAEMRGTWRRRSLPGYAPTTLMGKSDGLIYEDDRSTSTDEEMIWETKDFIFGHAFRLLEFRLYCKYGGFTLTYSIDGGLSWKTGDTFIYIDDWYEHVLYLNETVQRVRFRISLTATDFELKWIEIRYMPRERSKSLVS